MNIYLQELSNEYPGEEIILIMDQAGWHKSKDLIIPPNIKFIYLPPYSPELNPVERLWKYLKNNYIHNHLFASLKDMIDHLIKGIEILDENKIMNLCSCHYLDL